MVAVTPYRRSPEAEGAEVAEVAKRVSLVIVNHPAPWHMCGNCDPAISLLRFSGRGWGYRDRRALITE